VPRLAAGRRDVEGVSAAAQVAMPEARHGALGSDGRRLVIVDFERPTERPPLEHAQVKFRQLAPGTRHQLSLDMVNQGILLQYLEPSLERRHVHDFTLVRPQS
jgi:hypothetical protein